jgi:3-phenylpropionate/trans-cinnamate dioxygenase ferredoxin reductase component
VTTQQVAIIGAGLGALRTAEALRAHGFTGNITVIGDEPFYPYNRPPLSKEVLAGVVDANTLELPRKVDDITWLLGSPVIASDLEAHTVTLADGTTVAFDGLVIASGIRPRSLPIPGPPGNRYTLRTRADAEQLQPLLTPGTRVLIMGAGFIGCEVAATAISRGCEVTIVALDDEPMIRPLGHDLGAAMRRRHESQGVTFYLGHTIAEFTGEGEKANAAILDDGTVIYADVIIEAVGSVANTEWLADHDIDLTDGLETDSNMTVIDLKDRVPAVAVGDLARHPNALFGDVPRRIEHWDMPSHTGARAGATLAALMRGEQPAADPFAVVPSFWSDQYDVNLQSFGMPGIATHSRVVDGDVDGECIVEYHDESGLVGVIGLNRTRDLAQYRKHLLTRASEGK